MRVFVAGLEGSGNHWFREVLRQHPNLKVCGDSFPTGYRDQRHYMEPPEHDVMVIVARNDPCRRASVVRMQYELGTEDEFPDDRNMAKILAAADKSPKVVFGSYSTALIYRQRYWDFLFRCIGVDPVPVDTEYQDGNAKYLQAAHEANP